jgi:hypothetical protein
MRLHITAFNLEAQHTNAFCFFFWKKKIWVVLVATHIFKNLQATIPVAVEAVIDPNKNLAKPILETIRLVAFFFFQKKKQKA